MIDPQPEQANSRPTNKLKLIQFRNYNSHKQIRYNYFDSHSESPKNMPQLHKYSEPLLPSIHNNELTTHQTIRFKLSNPKGRLQMLRKNMSLKHLRSQEGGSSYNKSRAEETRQGELLAKQDRKCLEVVQSLNNISARRGLVKKGHNKLIIERKQKLKEVQKSDVSFQECLEKQPLQREKAIVPSKISSQNLLGNSNRKTSWVKMKALVTNPFERVIRYQQHLQQQQCNLSNLIQQQLKESQILGPADENSVSVTQAQQIQQLLSLL